MSKKKERRKEQKRGRKMVEKKYGQAKSKEGRKTDWRKRVKMKERKE